MAPKTTTKQDVMVGLVDSSSSDDDNDENGVPAFDDGNNNHVGQHPELIKMCVVNANTMTRIVPNSQPYPIDNEMFEGQVMMLIRTPDVDESNEVNFNMGETPRRISQYLKPKLRRFEFQFRVKLKKIPTGPLFLGCELEHPIKIGKVMKGLTSVLLAMCRRINPGFHYSWGIEKNAKNVDHEAIEEGRYEKTHLSFPVEASMDRIVITKPGEEPPPLGYELFESPESVKRRRKMGAGSVDWNLEDTYTMCLWSAYCDWIKWKCLNVPGVRPFSLCAVTEKQPIYLSVYEVNGVCPEEYKRKRPPHNRKDLGVHARFEFSNSVTTRGGLANKILGGKYQPLETFVDTETEKSSDTASESGHITT